MIFEVTMRGLILDDLETIKEDILSVWGIEIIESGRLLLPRRVFRKLNGAKELNITH